MLYCAKKEVICHEIVKKETVKHTTLPNTIANIALTFSKIGANSKGIYKLYE